MTPLDKCPCGEWGFGTVYILEETFTRSRGVWGEDWEFLACAF
jgi:hypothetical protein